MSLDPDAAKWTCEYCTYENFPSALKCTMCRGAKPLISEDIYKLRDESRVQDTDASTKMVENCGSWRCEICKLINSAQQKECVACNTARFSEASIRDQFSALSIGENEITPSTENCQRSQSCQKWSCPVCTYENWPKAAKCIMCLTARSKISPVPSTNCVNSPEREVFINSRLADETNRSKKWVKKNSNRFILGFCT